MMILPLFEITGVLFQSENNNDGGSGGSNEVPLVVMVVAVGGCFPAGTIMGKEVIRSSGRPMGTMVGGGPSVATTVFVDRAESFWVVLCFFKAFLFDFNLAYNSNTLASSGEENWERMSLVLVLFLLL